jgi:hypothetical protein
LFTTDTTAWEPAHATNWWLTFTAMAWSADIQNYPQYIIIIIIII